MIFECTWSIGPTAFVTNRLPVSPEPSPKCCITSSISPIVLSMLRIISLKKVKSRSSYGTIGISSSTTAAFMKLLNGELEKDLMQQQFALGTPSSPTLSLKLQRTVFPASSFRRACLWKNRSCFVSKSQPSPLSRCLPCSRLVAFASRSTLLTLREC